MRILFINPNATVSMTHKIGAAARAAASPGTFILSATNHAGPASIQGPADGEAAEPGLLALIAERDADADAFVIACFDDTGLETARTLTGKPVIGIGEAAMRAAADGNRAFSVVTTLSVSIPVIEENVRAYGLGSLCRRVRASEVPVLALEEPGSAARETVAAEIAAALGEDQPGAVVLGCAGMADLAETFAARFGVPVFDGVVCAVKALEAQSRDA
ncbi:aspartate/glutamate racemase family protein [Aureimonas phyllosphaerae]|uniref:Allantoin racemase n=1 Tax=Aureimonas phyllosphaerae TaxID=1166078 RepID=A0A7W6BWQ6_9HYPH|nr:aspartate/glutamate racemase family protein [Aureimonas phyllosphaerae]MBB3934182.1 allantoin racemase [Aureimonas phyllosphaerae]MBB3958602.1 allantoin racemase [Aureimonas phyllosphaerae]SFE99489.1 allantoin racemase [Aureimonas phyllosphaerae]